MLYQNLTWKETSSILSKKKLLIPVGSIEQHGYCLPIGVDFYLAEAITRNVTQRLQAVMSPTIPYGARSLPNSGGGDSFPGTIYINGDVLISYYSNIFYSYLKTGCSSISVINAHWENECFLIEAAEQIKNIGLFCGKEIHIFSWWSVLNENNVKQIFNSFTNWQFEHAGIIETSLMLHYYPELMKKYIISSPSKGISINPNVYTYPTNEKILNNYGSLSSLKGACAIKGKKLAELTEDEIVKLLSGG